LNIPHALWLIITAEFFEKKGRILSEVNEKTLAWAKRVKTLVRANKTLSASTDSYSKILVQVTLEDPVANRLEENDDCVDRKNFVIFEALCKELLWRIGRIKLCIELQVFLKRLTALREMWKGREDNVETFNIHEFTAEVADCLNDGGKIDRHFNKVVLDVRTELVGVLKELRMKGVGGGDTPKFNGEKGKGGEKRRHSL
jgi:hypothetical protein